MTLLPHTCVRVSDRRAVRDRRAPRYNSFLYTINNLYLSKQPQALPSSGCRIFYGTRPSRSIFGGRPPAQLFTRRREAVPHTAGDQRPNSRARGGIRAAAVRPFGPSHFPHAPGRSSLRI